MPNLIENSLKIKWLKDLDERTYRDICAGCCIIEAEERDFTDAYANATELLIEEPDARDIYTFYMLAKISAMNAEPARYNQYSVMFNDAFSIWQNAWMRRHGGAKRSYRF